MIYYFPFRIAGYLLISRWSPTHAYSKDKAFTQLDLTVNWKHCHYAPGNRFIPVQTDIASLLHTVIFCDTSDATCSLRVFDTFI